MRDNSRDENTERKLFNSDACTISFDPEVHCLVVEWRGYIPTEKFRLLAARIPEFLKATGTTKILADDSLLESMLATEQEWIIRQWLPHAIEMGYKTCALIRSHSYFTRVIVEENVKKMSSAVSVEFFDNRSEAKKWLRTLD